MRLAVIPGDGIGKEIVPEGLKVLDRKVVDVLAGKGDKPMRVFEIIGPHGCEALIQIPVDVEVWCVPARQPDVTA